MKINNPPARFAGVSARRAGAQKLKIAKLAKKFELKLIIIFGSFANGKNREHSDLDIAVLGLKEVSFNEQISLVNELSKILNKNIDLTVLNKANPLLLFEASKNSILLYGSGKEFLKFKLNAFKAYHDYTPYFAMEKNLNKKIISSYAN